jgi:molybdopterin molybdotransferase
MNPPILLEVAWKRLFALVRALDTEAVAVDEAAGRYLAEPVIARRTQPARDLSVMDGFAVAGLGPWRIVGESRAGAPFAASLSSDEAVAISTGAACPNGTEGIVLLEDATLDESGLSAPSPEAGRWIRRRGFDFADGAHLLDRGTRIGPGQLALARAAGHGTLSVARQPRVAIIECGDELVGDPEDCPSDRLPASNGAMVAAMAAGTGAVVERIGPLPDDRAVLAAAIAEAGDADVIVTTAGASVGEHDHVRGALADCGAELAFWRVAIRPGKPLLVGHLGKQIVLGLPGNPNSSFVTAFLFLLPLLRALQGAARALPVAFPLPLTSPLGAGGDRREFQRAQFRDGEVVPLAERDSSALATLAAADLLIDRPIDAPAAPAGTLVPCYWLGSGSIA